MDLQNIKNRYDIIGNDSRLNMAIHKAVQVAPTDLSILVFGESGVGKDVFSHIVHDFSNRKHKKLVAVNCGAIPEGTIESELFGHIKGAFTGADRDRKGYFEEADGGTIFLDEVGELPLATQVKLLRVLENGEIIPVGASTSKKVDVRVVAATNAQVETNIKNGRFREDLYYRLNQVSVTIPPLRERKEDIVLLFRKFSSDIAEKYNMPPIYLTDDAREYLCNYPWYGNIRELRNITQQIAVVETDRAITRSVLQNYLNYVTEETLPAIHSQHEGHTDRELLYQALSMGKMISEMRGEINQLRQAIAQLAQGIPVTAETLRQPRRDDLAILDAMQVAPYDETDEPESGSNDLEEHSEFHDAEVVEDEPLSLSDREKTAILSALERHNGNRRAAAKELGISERTIYRKLSAYDIK